MNTLPRTSYAVDFADPEPEQEIPPRPLKPLSRRLFDFVVFGLPLLWAYGYFFGWICKKIGI